MNKLEIDNFLEKQANFEGQCSICKSRWCPTKDNCVEDSMLIY